MDQKLFKQQFATVDNAYSDKKEATCGIHKVQF